MANVTEIIPVETWWDNLMYKTQCVYLSIFARYFICWPTVIILIVKSFFKSHYSFLRILHKLLPTMNYVRSCICPGKCWPFESQCRIFVSWLFLICPSNLRQLRVKQKIILLDYFFYTGWCRKTVYKQKLSMRINKNLKSQ